MKHYTRQQVEESYKDGKGRSPEEAAAALAGFDPKNPDPLHVAYLLGHLMGIIQDHAKAGDVFLCLCGGEIDSCNNPCENGWTFENFIKNQIRADGISVTGAFDVKGLDPLTSWLDRNKFRILWVSFKLRALIEKHTSKAPKQPSYRPGQYRPTVDITCMQTEDIQALHVGQWVSSDKASHGQYLGVSRAGTILINWKSGVDMRNQFKANKPLRKYAKLHGSK